MYFALNTAKFAECSLKPLVISFRRFHLAVCDAQAFCAPSNINIKHKYINMYIYI